MPAPPELTTAIRAAQRELTRGDAQAALTRLDAIAPAQRPPAVLRLQGLCLLLLHRPHQARDLAAAAQARHPSYPFHQIQSADLAWRRQQHWPALLAYLKALQQEPKLHNLWPRILKIAATLTAATPQPATPQPDAAAAPHQAELRPLLVHLAEQLLAKPTSPQQLSRLAQLLPLLPGTPAQPQQQAERTRHCRHALAALHTLEARKAPEPAA